MDRTEIAKQYFRIVWIRTAEKVIEKAIQLYKLDDAQAEALRKTFLKPNHYYTLIK